MLTEAVVRGLKPRKNRYMKADREGLYIEVLPGGQKYWWLVSQAGGKRSKISLGHWPEVGLAEARNRLAERKRQQRVARFDSSLCGVLFEEVAREWFRVRIEPMSASYAKAVRLRLEKYVLPPFWGREISSVTCADVLAVLKGVERLGFSETAHRVLNIFSQVFRFAMPFYVDADPTSGLLDKLSPVRTKHFARLTDRRDTAALMAAIRLYPRPRMRNALLFSAYTFVRPGEARHAEWKDFDVQGRVWRIPAEKMKERRAHVVPLARQVIDVLGAQMAILEAAGMAGRFVFPSERGQARPMSENGVRLAIRSMGFGPGEMTAHGFRGMASTILNESGMWSVDAIELQLAHVEKNSVRAAYNDATFFPQRVQMMQWYADQLDSLDNI